MKCVYKIVNVFNNSIYIGSAQDFERRKRAHLNKLLHNKHANKHLQSAYNMYGSECFAFSVLEEVLDDGALLDTEQRYIDSLTPEYNMCPIAGNSLGRKHSMESIEKIREHSVKRKHLQVTIDALSLGRGWNKGIPCSEKSKALMSKAKDAIKKSVTSVAVTGEITTYESIADAVRQNAGFSKTSISRACKNGKTYKNMEWDYGKR